VRQKCHPLFIDSAVNSDPQILENVYNVFLFTMYKLHACVKHLTLGEQILKRPHLIIGTYSRTTDENFTECGIFQLIPLVEQTNRIFADSY